MKLLFFFTWCDRHSSYSRLRSPIRRFISIKRLIIFWHLNLPASSLHTPTRTWPLPLNRHCRRRFPDKCLYLRDPTKQQSLHTLNYSWGFIVRDLSIRRLLGDLVIGIIHFFITGCHGATCTSWWITGAADFPGVTQWWVGYLPLIGACGCCWSSLWKSTQGFFICCWSDHICTLFIILLKLICNMSLKKTRGTLTTW
jgi:hypothetical protein